MAENEKELLQLDSIDVVELEDEALEGVAGGAADINDGCPVTNNCPNNNCPCRPTEL